MRRKGRREKIFEGGGKKNTGAPSDGTYWIRRSDPIASLLFFEEMLDVSI